MSSHLRYSTPVTTLAAALLLAACEAKTDTAPHADRPVQVQRVQYEIPVTPREYVGVVRARYDSDLGFRVSGKVVKRLANVGDRVHAGQVLAEIDASDLRLQVDSAEAELTAAKANLEQVAAEFDRYTVLKARGFASAADYDRKSAATSEAEGRRARAARALDLARKQLGYADLVAVSDGVITAVTVESGQVIAAGQTVMKLAHGEKEALVAIPENRRRSIAESDVTISLWSENGHTYAARLRELSPDADPLTRTYAARFSFLDGGDDAALGMTATVTLRHRGDARVARLPLSAVLDRGSGASVFVVDTAGRLRLQPVAVVAFNEKSALIAAGVANGETVVTLGVQKLEPGLKVRGVEGM